tara:strand:+ start:2443 stop:2964 length:522 start_codon:yes stop_codon:yes gene_type:complete
MKFFFLSLFCILLSFINPIKSENKIAFVDMDRIISTSNPGLSVLKQLKVINNKNLTFLNKEENRFKEKETKLISQKNIISEKDFRNKVDNLKLEIKNYKKSRTKMITEFNKIKVNNTNKLLKLINPILIKFSNEKEISVILQKKNLVIGKTELDITDEIIKIINSEIEEFKIK